MSILSAIVDLLFPPRCVFCRSLLTHGECAGCAATVRCVPPGRVYTIPGAAAERDDTQRYDNAAEPNGSAQPRFRAYAALYFEGAARDSIHRYKFGGMSVYAAQYGRILAERVSRELGGQFDLISWVPLSKKRLRKRGYDQARLLAAALRSALTDIYAAKSTLGVTKRGDGDAPSDGDRDVPPLVATLVKHTDVPAQSSTADADARRANISGVYRAAAPELIRGKRILLIDDVLTTGSTLSECAKTLADAGAAEIICAALAKTRETRRR